MARFLLTALAVFLASGASRAEAGMVLLVEADRSAYLVNESDHSVRVSGYQLSATTPAFDPAGWISIEDQVVSDSSTVVALLGDKL